MNNKEIKQMVKEMLEAQMDESGLSEEEVTEPTMLNLINLYYEDDIELKDLCIALDYLGYTYDESSLERSKQERIARKEKRRAYREKQRAKKLKKWRIYYPLVRSVSVDVLRRHDWFFWTSGRNGRFGAGKKCVPIMFKTNDKKVTNNTLLSI